MGSIVLPRSEFAATLSELGGHKAGLALNTGQLVEHLGPAGDVLHGDQDEILIIRSEEVEEIVALLLYNIGSTPYAERFSPSIMLRRKYRGRPEGVMLDEVLAIVLREMTNQNGSDEPFDLTPVAVRAGEELGPTGASMVMDFYHFSQVWIQQTPWSSIRRTEWTDIAQLDDLFKSESLETEYGRYVDQRFIDYLERNFAAIDRMNWRKFEGLTCEYFEREGFHVEIAEGRNDGGIDARIWPASDARSSPPTILVQCKRQKDKVEKVVVKALWADVVDEGAESGLIVTTSALSPGAAAVCKARAYPVAQADRGSLKTWLRRMRTPDAGVFLGL